MAAFEIVALDTASPKLRAPGAGDTLVANQTWNSGGTTFTGLQLNVTNTASAAASLLLDLRQASTTRFSVRGNDGFVRWNFGMSNGSHVALWENYPTALNLSGASQISWAPGNPSIGSFDLALARDAANILAQRNGRTAQRFRVYNDFIDSSNGEWFDIDWATTANVCTIGPRANGTGVVRPVTAVGAWTFSSTLTASGAISCSTLTTATSGFIGTTGKYYVDSAANGAMCLRGWSGTAMLLQFTGVSAEPALKRSSAALHARLADDSAFADFVFRIPTTNPGPGTLWNNGGVLTIGT